MKKWDFELGIEGNTIVLTQPDAKFRAVYSKQYWQRGLDMKERSTSDDYDLLTEAWKSNRQGARAGLDCVERIAGDCWG